MKRIVSTEVMSIENVTDNASLVEFLNSLGIDTTMHKYELLAEKYGTDVQYSCKFKCPGDYLAYFSMATHCVPTCDELDAHFDLEAFGEIVEENPGLADIEDYICSRYWGDGDDKILILKNLDTGDILYTGMEELIEYPFQDWK